MQNKGWLLRQRYQHYLRVYTRLKLCLSKLFVERDSTIVISWVSKREKGSWKFANQMRKIIDILGCFFSWAFLVQLIKLLTSSLNKKQCTWLLLLDTFFPLECILFFHPEGFTPSEKEMILLWCWFLFNQLLYIFEGDNWCLLLIVANRMLPGPMSTKSVSQSNQAQHTDWQQNIYQ